MFKLRLNVKVSTLASLSWNGKCLRDRLILRQPCLRPFGRRWLHGGLTKPKTARNAYCCCLLGSYRVTWPTLSTRFCLSTTLISFSVTVVAVWRASTTDSTKPKYILQTTTLPIWPSRNSSAMQKQSQYYIIQGSNLWGHEARRWRNRERVFCSEKVMEILFKGCVISCFGQFENRAPFFISVGWFPTFWKSDPNV